MDRVATAPVPSTPAAEPLCPLCGGPNACVPAACGHFDAPCWCRDVRFAPALLARIPPAQRGVACVCAVCASGGAGGFASGCASGSADGSAGATPGASARSAKRHRAASGGTLTRARPFGNAAVEQAFLAVPAAPRERLLMLRALIFDTAARTPGVGAIDETLKWGEPAYVTAQSGSGSTVRLGWKRAAPTRCAMYFNCRTTLVETFRSLFPTEFRYEGQRAIVFEPADPMPADSLAYCVAAALTYHLKKPRTRAPR